MPPESLPLRRSDFNCPCRGLEFTQVRWIGSKRSRFIKPVIVCVSLCVIREVLNSGYSVQLVAQHTATIFAQNSRFAPLGVHIRGHALWRANTESKLVDLFVCGHCWRKLASQGCSYAFTCVGHKKDLAMGAAKHFFWNRVHVNS